MYFVAKHWQVTEFCFKADFRLRSKQFSAFQKFSEFSFLHVIFNVKDYFSANISMRRKIQLILVEIEK